MTSAQEETLEAYREAFDLLDKDGSNSICANELGMLLRAVGENPTQREIDYFIKSCDKNKNNLIEFEDFVLLMDIIKRDATRKEDQMKTLERAFKIFDKNGDGFIEVNELSRVMTELGEKLSEEEVKQMLAVADVDKDGKINYKEFINYITKPVNKTPIGHTKHNHHKKK